MLPPGYRAIVAECDKKGIPAMSHGLGLVLWSFIALMWVSVGTNEPATEETMQEAKVPPPSVAKAPLPVQLGWGSQILYRGRGV